MKMDMSDQDGVIYANDFCIVREHMPNRPHDHRIAVRVGDPPEEQTPVLLDGAKLYVALGRYIHNEA